MLEKKRLFAVSIQAYQ